MPSSCPDWLASETLDAGPGTAARRHSISGGSLAEHIASKNPSLLFTNILSDLKTKSDQLSDFGSCISDSSSSEVESVEENEPNDGGFLSLNEKKRIKKKKRKLKLTPGKEQFLKKPNLLE